MRQLRRNIKKEKGKDKRERKKTMTEARQLVTRVVLPTLVFLILFIAILVYILTRPPKGKYILPEDIKN